MDGLSAFPVQYSSLAKNELDDLSESDETESVASPPPPPAAAEAGDALESSLREKHVRPRFERWLAGGARADAGRTGLLRAFFERLELLDLSADNESSTRHFVLEFRLGSMSGHYEQYSQADTRSPIWRLDDEGAVLRLVPNLRCELLLDGASVVSGEAFAAGGGGSSGDERRVDEERLMQRFGTENVSKIGGVGTLLEFLGVACADSGAPEYADLLPFGIPSALIAVGQRDELEVLMAESAALNEGLAAATAAAAAAAEEAMSRDPSKSGRGEAAAKGRRKASPSPEGSERSAAKGAKERRASPDEGGQQLTSPRVAFPPRAAPPGGAPGRAPLSGAARPPGAVKPAGPAPARPRSRQPKEPRSSASAAGTS